MDATTETRAPEQVGKGRVEALSDGVFAIVVTLLVLEIKVPHVEAHDSIAAVAEALLALAPKFVSWVISFATVCVIWLNHHRLFTVIGRIDNGLFWRNANLLLWTSFIPFPTALMGDYPGNRLAVSFYGLVMCLMAFAFVLMRRHLLRHDELVQEHADRARFRAGTRDAILMGPVAYAIGAALAWVSTAAAFVCYAAIAAYFVRPRGARPGR
ncbi:MAG: TMEM175 family protein [Rhodospirillaceae bacterium]